jgi:hypothetical protein
MNTFSLFLLSFIILQSIGLSKCKYQDTSMSPEVTTMTKADSLQETVNRLQTKMDSILKGLSFKEVSTSAEYNFDKLKSSVYALVNFDPITGDFGFGTACVVDSSGLALSNYHVISEYQNIVCVKPGDSVEINVNVLSKNEELDYVILQLDTAFAPYSPLTKANFIPTEGSDVYAIGHPEGLSFTLTKGIISAFRAGDTYIQSDAAISHGNSGGPLLDKDGALIGINSFKYKDGENLNFALNINYIPYQHYLPSLKPADTIQQTTLAENNMVHDNKQPHQPEQSICIDRALRAYSNALIEHNPDMLINLSGNGLMRFNESRNVTIQDVRKMVSTLETAAADARLIENDLDWKNVKYSSTPQTYSGTLESIISYGIETGKIVNTHIRMEVILDKKCNLKQAFYSTINSF